MITIHTHTHRHKTCREKQQHAICNKPLNIKTRKEEATQNRMRTEKRVENENGKMKNRTTWIFRHKIKTKTVNEKRSKTKLREDFHVYEELGILNNNNNNKKRYKTHHYSTYPYTKHALHSGVYIISILQSRSFQITIIIIMIKQKEENECVFFFFRFWFGL